MADIRLAVRASPSCSRVLRACYIAIAMPGGAPRPFIRQVMRHKPWLLHRLIYSKCGGFVFVLLGASRASFQAFVF